MSLFDKLLEEISEESVNTLHKSVKFVAGETQIPVTGKVFGKEEIKSAMKASAEFWLTSGPYALEFESRFAKKLECAIHLWSTLVLRQTC